MRNCIDRIWCDHYHYKFVVRMTCCEPGEGIFVQRAKTLLGAETPQKAAGNTGNPGHGVNYSCQCRRFDKLTPIG